MKYYVVVSIDSSVFPVGETVLAATRGINIWCCPHPSCEGLQLIFLDMEGLDDTAKARQFAHLKNISNNFENNFDYCPRSYTQ